MKYDSLFSALTHFAAVPPSTLSLLSGYLPNLSVDFNKIFVDTDYEFRGGTIRSKYEIENWYKFLDLNALTHGGELTAKLANGQLTPDKVVEGTIASVDAIVVETTKNENGEVTAVTSVSVSYIDGTGTAKTLKLAGTDLTPKETEFNTLVIKDASNTYYAVDLKTGAAALIGRYSKEASELLAGLNIFKLGVADASKAVIFSRNQNVWAFDEAKDPYTKSAYYAENYNKVTYLGSSTNFYPTPWQFLPKGGAPQEVKATIPDGYDMAKMKFVTSTGLEITPKADGGRDLILPLQPASGEELYLVYAFVMNADGTATYCGAMNVMTRSIKTYKAKLVKLGGSYDLAALRTELNNIYNPCGIIWDLTEDEASAFYEKNKTKVDVIVGSGLVAGDKWFSEYTDQQKQLNQLYREYTTTQSNYDDKTVYLFTLPTNNAPSNNLLGDMPIGKQWGYLFGDVTTRTLAHELGHGKLSLTHTFAQYLTQGSTSNLMDYPSTGSGIGGTELVARQWESMHDLAMFDPFQNDADGAATVDLKEDYEYERYYGHDKILDYLLGDGLSSMLQELNITNYFRNSQKNPQTAVFIIENVLGNVKVGDENEAVALIEEFHQNYFAQQLSLIHEDIMAALVASGQSTFPRQTVLQKIYNVLGYASATLTAIGSIADDYQEIWSAHNSLEVSVVKDFRDILLLNIPKVNKSVEITNTGMKELLKNFSNTQFKKLYRDKFPSVTNKQMKNIMELRAKGGFSYDNLIGMLKDADKTKIINQTDDITLASIRTTTNFKFNSYNNTVAKLSIAGSVVNYLQLIVTMQTDKKVEPLDILSVMPNALALGAILGNLIINDTERWLYESFWQIAPNWNFVVNWDQKYKGKPGSPNDYLYVCYTDQKSSFRPDVVPTSILFLNKSDANAVFGFTPSIADFDVKSVIIKQEDWLYFRPSKQVEITW